MANILYLSAHEVLEMDEVKLFTELGHSVFSMGAYQTANHGAGLRGPIPNLYQNDHLRGVSIQCSKENIHSELIEWSDVIVSMHNARVDVNDYPQPWLKGNWKKFKDLKKPVIWRSIGQSNRQIEESLKPFRKDGLKIVRYSPFEETIPSYQGGDALIRFYKDPDEYKDWNGQVPHIVNISQALFGSDTVRSRGDHMSKDVFDRVVEGFDWRVFGPDNEKALLHNGGVLSHEDLKQMLRFNRVFFYTGTRPASYTLGFIEAFMTGIPIVSIGPEHGNDVYKDQKTFEVHEIIGQSGGAGFWSDSIEDLRRYCKLLLDDHELAKEVSAKGRTRAIEYFGKAKIAKEWEVFLNSL